MCIWTIWKWHFFKAETIGCHKIYKVGKTLTLKVFHLSFHTFNLVFFFSSSPLFAFNIFLLSLFALDGYFKNVAKRQTSFPHMLFYFLCWNWNNQNRKFQFWPKVIRPKNWYYQEHSKRKRSHSFKENMLVSLGIAYIEIDYFSYGFDMAAFNLNICTSGVNYFRCVFQPTVEQAFVALFQLGA